MKVLVVGASGLLGSELVPRLIARGHTVYGLARRPPEPQDNLIPVKGDIMAWDLGLEQVPADIEAVYHLAALIDLGEKDYSRFLLNTTGTLHVLNFMLRHNIPRLFYVSTAYQSFRNNYETSKYWAECLVSEFAAGFAGFHPPITATIFKPSILLGSSAPAVQGAFYQFVALMVRVHRRAEVVRRKLEGMLRLPVIEPSLRIRGNSEGRLNLVPVGSVAQAIAETEEEGTFWLTNPDPPSLGELGEWVGELLLLKIRFEDEFAMSPIEALFHRGASPFLPYLRGDDFPSDLKNCPEVGREYIQGNLRSAILSLSLLSPSRKEA